MTTSKTEVRTTHVEAHAGFDHEWRDEKWDSRSLTNAANAISQEEQQTSAWEAIKQNPMAIMWCLIVSSCVIMEGYGKSFSLAPIPGFNN